MTVSVGSDEGRGVSAPGKGSVLRVMSKVSGPSGLTSRTTNDTEPSAGSGKAMIFRRQPAGLAEEPGGESGRPSSVPTQLGKEALGSSLRDSERGRRVAGVWPAALSVDRESQRGVEGHPAPRVPWAGQGDSHWQHYRATCPTSAGIESCRWLSVFADDEDGWTLVLLSTAGATALACLLGGAVMLLRMVL